MPKKKLASLRCPTCRKVVLAKDPEFPFCSERCRTIDLGRWLSGGYVISTPVNDPESGGETEYNGERRTAPRRPASSPESENDGRGPN
jgi:endogenous inhibitor of DNA gyrase (YacG/DUF329 family)